MPTQVEKIKKKAAEKKQPQVVDYSKGLSWGIDILNLCCTGKATIGLLPDTYVLLVGDSAAGKTYVSRLVMAMATITPFYKNHRLVEDNPERGSLFLYAKHFGKTMASLVEPPSKKGSSKTLEEFYDNVHNLIAEKRPFIEVLDSEDALSPEADLKKSAKDRKSRQSNDSEDKKGSYGTAKAKINSSELRAAHNELEGTNSILLVIKQTRDSIGFGAKFNPKTRSGGRALTFYATQELWFSIVGKIQKTVEGHKVAVGSVLKVHVKKNRTSGKDRSVEVMFYPDTGVDNTGTNVNFLIEWGHWKLEGKNDEYLRRKVIAPEFKFEGSEDRLIQKIESEGREKELTMLVTEKWLSVEEELAVVRKNRFA